MGDNSREVQLLFKTWNSSSFFLKLKVNLFRSARSPPKKISFRWFVAVAKKIETNKTFQFDFVRSKESLKYDKFLTDSRKPHHCQIATHFLRHDVCDAPPARHRLAAGTSRAEGVDKITLSRVILRCFLPIWWIVIKNWMTNKGYLML